MEFRDRLPFDVRFFHRRIHSLASLEYIGWLDDEPPAKEWSEIVSVVEWLKPAVPSQRLRQWCAQNDGWYDFDRRYRLELDGQHGYCERLLGIARSRVLWLAGGAAESMQRGIGTLKKHLELLEAERRYRAGWIIGGLSWPVRDEILRRGGLWLARHKTWTLPDRDSWQAIQDLLPGDF